MTFGVFTLTKQEDKKMLYGLKQLLFKRMQNDMGVMSEHADNILEL